MGKYRIIARLGEGGMAQVHLALMHGSLGFNKLVVIKSMRDHLADPIFERSFLHEARLAAQLNHPNVVQTYDVGEYEGRPFIAMEFVDGQAMRVVQRRLAPQRLPLNTQLKILVDVARGLHHAHSAKSFEGQPLGIVHRDVSPQNVMLTYDGQVKLLDFGIAKADGNDELTRDGMIKGKIDYMPPEQLKGERVDARTDVFPLGVMLWEAVTGKRFSGGAEIAELTKIHNRLMAREPRLREAAPSTPMRLVEICDRALAPEPELRQHSAEQFANEISEYLVETSQTVEPIADILGPLFAKERAALRGLIDEQVRLANSKEIDDAELSVDDLPIVMSSDTGASTPSSKSSFISFDPDSLETSLVRGGSRSNSVPWMVVAVLVAGVGLAAYQFRSASQDPEPSDELTVAETSLSATTADDRSAAADEVSTVSVRIEADQEDATATLDDAPIDLPFSGRLADDGKIHYVRVESDGHRPFERAVLFNQDVSIRAALSPIAAEAEPQAEAPPPRPRRGRVARSAMRGSATTGSDQESGPTPAPRPEEPAAAPTRPAGAVAPPTPAASPSRPSIVSDDPYR